MHSLTDQQTIITTKIILQLSKKKQFIDWQKKFHSTISTFPGFKSLEISSSKGCDELTWLITQQFQNPDNIFEWKNSETGKELINELKSLADPAKENNFEEEMVEAGNVHNGITEVLVTQVAPGKEKNYHEWIAKIHAIEATFPGFRGLYVQSPQKEHERNWVTLLQFDTQKNLENWLTSPERKQILAESKDLIASLENHRLISPYGGWFASVEKGDAPPPVWKQTMIVLLVLFPIVVLEMKFLHPLIQSLNPSLGTFIGNAISVSLIAWPMMPIAIRYLGWWLTAEKSKTFLKMTSDTFIILLFYLIEIILFWNFI